MRFAIDEAGRMKTAERMAAMLKREPKRPSSMRNLRLKK